MAGDRKDHALKDAARLIDDFFDEVERVLTEKGVPFQAVEGEEGEKS